MWRTQMGFKTRYDGRVFYTDDKKVVTKNYSSKYEFIDHIRNCWTFGWKSDLLHKKEEWWGSLDFYYAYVLF